MNALLRKIMRWKLRSINLTLAIFLILAFGYSYPQIRDISGSPQKLYRVLRVVDGDTLEIEGIGQVRLIGVDTPELYHPLKPVQYYAKEASEFVRNLVGQSMVRVEYDQEKTDKYGRTLAYVYLEDGRCLNEEIIKNGYGFAFTRFAFKSLIKYKTLEAQAGQKGLGLWANHGLDEFNWIIAQKTLRYEIFEMANNWWAVRYKDFIKLRLSAEELQKELNNLRQWTNEFSESDLERTLLDNGWLKVGR
jgi:endonuclease YncB( thermonuclease family)